jgi:hypothetical protein
MHWMRDQQVGQSVSGHYQLTQFFCYFGCLFFFVFGARLTAVLSG